MKHLTFCSLLTVMVATVLMCNGWSKGVVLLSAFAAESTTGGTLGVDQLMKNANKYNGSIRVEGVVSAVSRADHMLSLIDKEEFKKCGVVTCATLTLPVRWAGSMPSVRDEVFVQGEVKENSGKLFFDASKLEAAVPQPGHSR